MDEPTISEEIRSKYHKKFASEDKIFRRIRRGDSIFISTGCGEPQYLVQALVAYVDENPSALFDAEVFQLWTLGMAPYADKRFEANFRYNSFFIGDTIRDVINKGLADYTPIFLSQIPDLIHRQLVPIDVALIQTTPPDEHGYMSLGVSVDISKAAVESAELVVAQVNSYMPRLHGDGFIHIDEVDYLVPYDEPLLEFSQGYDSEIIRQIGHYASRLIQDGDTIQVGYGSTPDALLRHLYDKKHLGIHTELLTEGLVNLIRAGVVDNSQKTANRGRTLATFCMGSQATYEFINDNPTIEFRTADYTNNPLVIARHDNMRAINSALEVDLTGQATTESIGSQFYRGIGGNADFMRGAILARNGESILTLPSTAQEGAVSRILPQLASGAGVTLNRGEVHYVVTEYGIAYLHGKNIRERAMELISVAHPKFRPWLIEEAKKLNLIYADQAYITSNYPAELETYRTTHQGLEIFMRPVKISDEGRLKEFFHKFSDESLYRRFMSKMKSIPHEMLQDWTVIDYSKDMIILAIIKASERQEEIIGVSQFSVYEDAHMADAAFAVADDYHGMGVGTTMLEYLTYIAKRRGLVGFTADVMFDNIQMLHVFENMFDLDKKFVEGSYEVVMLFKKLRDHAASKSTPQPTL